MALGEIGKRLEDRKEVVRALQRAVQDESWQVRGAVWRALEGMAEAGEELGDPRAETARKVAVRLSMLHEEVEGDEIHAFIEMVKGLEDISGAIPVLQAALREERGRVRAGVARAMAWRSEEVEDLEPVIAVLIEEIERHPDYSELETFALERIVVKSMDRIKEPSELVPLFCKIWDQEEEEGKTGLGLAGLVKLGPKAKDPAARAQVVGMYLGIFGYSQTFLDGSTETWCKRKAIEGLMEMAKGVEDPVFMIAQYGEGIGSIFHHYYTYVARDLLRAIAENIKRKEEVLEVEDTSTAISTLWTLIYDYGYPEARWGAAEVLEALCGRLANPMEIVEQLGRRLLYTGREEGRVVGWVSAVVICKLGGVVQAESMVQEFREKLEGEEEVEKDWVPKKLRERPKGGEGLRSMLESLRVEKVEEWLPEREIWAAEVCGRMLSQFEEPLQVLPTLRKLWKAGGEEVRSFVTGILGEMGRQLELEDIPVIMEALVDILKGGTEKDRARAAEILGAVEWDLESLSRAVAALLEVLQDESVLVCNIAVEAIGRIGGRLEDPSPVIARLREVLSEGKGSEMTRWYVEEAVKEVQRSHKFYWE